MAFLLRSRGSRTRGGRTVSGEEPEQFCGLVTSEQYAFNGVKVAGVVATMTHRRPVGR
jgi:hypothetical protein